MTIIFPDENREEQMSGESWAQHSLVVIKNSKVYMGIPYLQILFQQTSNIFLLRTIGWSIIWEVFLFERVQIAPFVYQFKDVN